MSQDQIVNKDDLVIRFAGDSGDGMQLSGTLFSDASALTGNDIATFPDYPAEIRAPHNTVAGVSGYQVHVGSHIYSSGDKCDILVAMNPAAFKSQLKWAKKGATVIVDMDTFTEDALEKAGYKENPFTDELERAYTIVRAPITSFTAKIGEEQGADKKTTDKCRNMFALGMIFFLTHKTLEKTFAYLERKFAKKPEVVKLNKAVLSEGYEYADKLELIHSKIVEVAHAEMPKGSRRSLSSCMACFTRSNTPSPRRPSVASLKPSRLNAGMKFLTRSRSSAKASSIRVPFVKARNWQSLCFSHSVMRSFLRTVGSPPV